MKTIKITLVCSTLVFSGVASAGWADYLNQANDTAQTVQKTSATINAVNNVVQNKPAVSQADQTSLVGALVQQLGVTPAQAQGGSGALFQVARNKMPASDFAQVSQSIPNMNGLLAAAPQPQQASSTGNLLGGLAALSGNSSLIGAASLVNTFQQLNLSEGMVSQFTPIVVNYVQQKGGALTANLLQSALTAP